MSKFPSDEDWRGVVKHLKGATTGFLVAILLLVVCGVAVTVGLAAVGLSTDPARSLDGSTLLTVAAVIVAGLSGTCLCLRFTLHLLERALLQETDLEE